MNRPAITIWLTAVLLTLASASLAQQSDKDGLLAQGDQYAAEGKLIEARDAYERAIASGAALENDSARSRTLGLCYMNAEPHDYAKAAKWLETALRLKPDDGIRLNLAQALSWSGQYRPAIAHYEQLVRDHPEDRTLKLQLARVLSWSKDFSAALSIYDQLHAGSSEDLEVLIERARVLSWSGRYDEATQAYTEALKHDPKNIDARIGQAQVLYWSGKPDAALSVVEDVLNQEPTNTTAHYLMAALEHNRGEDARALQWLQHAYPDKDTNELRNLIAREMRPVLHLQFGFADDREEPTSGVSSTYRTLRYTGTIGFNVTDNIRMEVANTVTQNAASTPILTQFGADSLATQTVGRLHFSIAPWLRLSAGAGDATTGTGTFEDGQAPRRHQLIYDVHPVITHAGLRIDITSVRSIADYTPLAVHDNLVQRREAIAASYTLARRVRFGSEYWHGTYRIDIPDPNLAHFSTTAQGGSASLLPILYSNERFALEAGVRYDIFQFADKTAAILDPVYGLESSGIFMPHLYQRYAGTGHIRWTPYKRFRMELDGTYGPQRIFGFASLTPPPADWGNTGSFGVRLTIPGARLEPYVAYDFFSTDTPASPGLQVGTFSSNSFLAGLPIRF